MNADHHGSHRHGHAFASLNARANEGLVVGSRRSFLKAGLAGMGGLSLPEVLRQRARAAEAGRPVAGRKSVILLWMAGGPSHIDTLDPKPNRPLQNRGPFGVIPTRLPGVIVCEHLPKLAGMLDRFSLIRSVDARFSNHEPNKVFQTGNREAEPRINPEAVGQMLSAFVAITPLDPSQPDDAPARLHDIAEIEACYSVAGEESYILFVRVESPRALEGLLQQIRTTANVRTRSTIILNTFYSGRVYLPE